MQLFRVSWRYQGRKSSTTIASREAADRFAADMRKRGCKSVSVSPV